MAAVFFFVLLALVGGAGRSLDEIVLVGERGDVYRRTEAGWTRAAGGGTSATLTRAVGVGGTEVWAVGERLPPYVWDGRAWSVSPGSGRAAGPLLSMSGTPAIAVAKRVFLRSQGKWNPLPASGATAHTALWAGSPRAALVGTDDGGLWRWNGVAWKKLGARLAAGEHAIAIVPVSAATQLVVGSAGAVLLAGAAAAPAAGLEPRLTGFRAAAAGASANRVVVVGEASFEGTSRPVLAALEGRKLVLVDVLPPGAPATPVATVVTAGGDVLLAGRDGAVAVRQASGAWSIEQVKDGLPPGGSPQTNPPAVSSGP